MFAEFGSVPLFYVSERCGVVSVSSFEVVFCESDVRFTSVFALRVTVAWQITDVWRQFRPLSGQVFFCRQLQVLLSFVFVLFAMSSMCWGEFKTRLL